MLRRAVPLALALLAWCAGPAAAATIDKVGRDLVYTGGAEENDVSGYTDMFDSVHILSMNAAGVPTGFGDSGCVPQYVGPNPTSFKCPRINIDRLVFRGGGGDDNLGGGWDKPQALDGGDGDDRLEGHEGNDVLRGGAGDDWLIGDPGADDIQGGSGADRLEGGYGALDGADTFSGGDGVDVVNFNYADVGVVATIDGVANDGEPGEGDNVLTDVENFIGSPEDDVLTGSAGANSIGGRGGNDTITGLGGRDELFGDDGVDTIHARDGIGEPVECGAGAPDIAIVDDVDGEPSECEDVRSNDEAQRDHDGDGVDRPADCDDRNAARRPGLRDVPENGIDEDCSGADAPNLDRDADGFPVPRDCDDANPAVRPGAREIVGNAADENCDGRKQPFPAVGVIVGDAWDVRRGAARVDRLQLDGVKAGTAVALRCDGKGCAFKRRTVRAGKGRTLDLRKALKGTKLRKGTVLELRITRPDTIGSVIRFTGRRRGIPSRRDLCLPPGGRPGACR